MYLPILPLHGAGTCSSCLRSVCLSESLTVQLVQQACTSQLAGQDFPDTAGTVCWSRFRRRLRYEGAHLLKGSCGKAWVILLFRVLFSFVFFFPKNTWWKVSLAQLALHECSSPHGSQKTTACSPLCIQKTMHFNTDFQYDFIKAAFSVNFLGLDLARCDIYFPRKYNSLLFSSWVRHFRLL